MAGKFKKIAVGFMAFLSLFTLGCSDKKKPENGTDIEEEHGKLTKISVSCNHMDYSACYSFYLRYDGEKILFDASFCPCIDSSERVEIECAEISDGEILEKVSEILDRYGAYEACKNYKKTESIFEVCDETTYYFSATWDSQSFNTDCHHYFTDELVSYFKDLAENIK